MPSSPCLYDRSLCDLTNWSMRHIQAVFESPTQELALEAIANTFSQDVTGAINGASLRYDTVVQLVTTMRNSSLSGLVVTWKQTIQVPRQSNTYRDGCFGGTYLIRGIQKPNDNRKYERRKTVTAIIESQSTDISIDSRRITSLVLVASDYPMDADVALARL